MASDVQLRTGAALGRRVGFSAVLLAGWLLQAPTVTADTRVVPYFSVAERYDTNVYFFSASNKIQDYVTTVVPGARVEHRGTLVEGNVNLQMTGEYYVRNPGLNYFFPSGGLYANLNKWAGQYDQRWRLQVSENFQFTPQPPAFVAPLGSTQPYGP